VAQHSNEHLTIVELSAYIDDELASEELALCAAHIQTCQPCLAALADLELTSALLGGLPQVEVPRSFALPTNLVLLPKTPGARDTKPVRAPSIAPRIWARSLRVASTLVAVLGLLLFLAGAISALPHGGATTSTSTAANAPSTSSGASALSTQNVPASTATALAASTPQQRITSADIEATRKAQATGAASNTLTPTPMSTPVASNNNTPGSDQSTPDQQPLTSQPALPVGLDLGQTPGRLAIGGALLLLGILGVFLARLFDRKTRR
jgi:hypothetical protein